MKVAEWADYLCPVSVFAFFSHDSIRFDCDFIKWQSGSDQYLLR